MPNHLEVLVEFLFIYSIFGWVFSMLLRRGDLADVFWGPGFLILNWIGRGFGIGSGVSHAGIDIQTALIAAWALRLTIHIGMRNFTTQKSIQKNFIKNQVREDYRYLNWRASWGKNYWWRSYLQIWLLQGFLMALVSLSFLARVLSDRQIPFHAEFGILEILGIFLAIVGLLTETIADWQLSQFKKYRKPKQIMMTGLWRYSRHPNYFGESLFWWGIALQTIAMTDLTLQPSLSLFGALCGALVITILVRFISGVPLLEAEMKKRSEYKTYIETVPAFFPAKIFCPSNTTRHSL